MENLPKTEAELQALINEKVQASIEATKKEYDGKFASQRTKYEKELDELKRQNELGKEEYAKQKIAEQQEADQKELAELRAYKKSALISERLAKDGLPSYFKNDSRLLSASAEEFEKAYKEVKADYQNSQPKGSGHSTVVPTGGNTPTNGKGESAGINEFGEMLKQII